ncbi:MULTISPECIES: YfhO family protein [unclassified Rhizobium]|uniref:YfhO family protein n=1 Tax=unclassified Rhizobium TaxID=2613769 RepID=UPI001ADCF7C0|nr:MULTISPECIES: YfhO family protein [unclassified Rhizobium]MBO9123167.1 YfhO family protein [Rhizobium sp. 16-488-2b]MBO9173699.1 YfhO family protein [Rhizobium sp. 16-488-2a]
MLERFYSRVLKQPVAMLFLAAVALSFFYFIFFGKTIGSTAQQMASYYPWRGAGIDLSVVKSPYPQTDFADSFFPHWRFLAAEIRAGHLPFWYPFDFGGTRAPETGLFGFYYPPRLILFFLFGAMWGHTIMMVLHAFFALAFSYKFLKWLDCFPASAFLGAVVWTFNGHNIYHLSLEFVMIIAAWLPLSLWCAGRAIQDCSWRYAVLSGTATGLTWFSGYANYSYAFGVVTFVWWLVLIGKSQGTLTFRSIRPFALAGVAALSCLLVGAAIWLPFLDVFRSAIRIPATLDVQLSEAISPIAALKGIVWPDSLSGPVWGYDSPSMIFVGGPALLMAAIAIFNRRSCVWFFFILGILSFLFVVGFGPLFLVGHAIVPMFGAIHPSTIGSQLFVLAISTLAAFGLDQFIVFTSAYIGHARARGIAYLAAGSTTVLLFILLQTSQPIEPIKDKFSFPATPLISKAAALQSELQFRLVPAQPVGTNWQPPIFFAGSAASAGLKSVFGYDSLVQPENFWIAEIVASGGIAPSVVSEPSKAALGSIKIDQLPINLLEALSVGLVAGVPGATPDEQQIRDGGLKQVYSGNDGSLWIIPKAAPRAFMPSGWRAMPWSAEALSVLTDPGYRPQDRVVLHPANSDEQTLLATVSERINTNDSKVSIAYENSDHLTLDVVSQEKSLVVVNDTWAPGWRAEVNGSQVPIFRANYAYRAIIVPAGRSVIKMKYEPLPLIIGIAITALSLIAIGIVIGSLWLTRLKANVKTPKIV